MNIQVKFEFGFGPINVEFFLLKFEKKEILSFRYLTFEGMRI